MFIHLLRRPRLSRSQRRSRAHDRRGRQRKLGRVKRIKANTGPSGAKCKYTANRARGAATPAREAAAGVVAVSLALLLAAR